MSKYGDMTPDELRARAKELHEDFKSVPDIEKRSGEDSEKLSKLYEEVQEVDGLLSIHEIEDRRRNAELASTRSVGPEERPPATIGDALLASEDFRRWAEAGAKVGPGTYHGAMASENSPSVDVELRGVGTGRGMETRAYNEFTTTGSGTQQPIGNAYDTGNAGILAPLGQPIPPVPRQARLFLRDLMPSMTTTLAQVPYVRELSPTAQEAATAVGEGGNKPGANLNFQGDHATPTVLAATLTLSRQLFEDAPAVAQYINARLPYLIRFKEDAEFLNGSGTWPDIRGILNTTNVQTQAFTTDVVTSIGNGIADVENSDGVATAVVMNPTDAWSMFTHRASTSGVLDAGTPFASLPLTVWGVPSYRSRAYATGHALVGDFQRGALVIDRESVNVQIYRERYAELNQLLVVCESRVGLAVLRPDLFVQTATA